VVCRLVPGADRYGSGNAFDLDQRDLAKPCGYRLPGSSTLCFPKRCVEVLPPGLVQALEPVLEQIAPDGANCFSDGDFVLWSPGAGHVIKQIRIADVQSF
jgi:hypothetical protein